MTFLNPRTIEEQTDVLAQYLRNDRLFLTKNDQGSNLRKVLLGLASEFIYFRNKINEVVDEYDPNQTTQLIEEWENFVGIPDSCISNTGTLEERRSNILLKLAGINATTKKQFKTIINTLGFSANVDSAIDVASLPFTLPFILVSEAEAPFTIIVTLDESLQNDPVPAILICLFNKLIPAHCQVFFRFGVVV